MIRRLYPIITLCLVLAIPGIAGAIQGSIGGEMWSRWTLQTGTLPADNSTVIKQNSIALERGYVDFRTNFNKNTDARFTVDLFSTDSQKDGAGLKLKYGFVDFKNLIPIPDSKLSVGLQKVYFGSIYDWDYTLIGKAPVDEYKLASSADYGISVNGKLPSDKGEYALGLYNGEGYKNYGANLKENTRFEILANLRYKPISYLTLGGSFMTNSVGREKDLTLDLPVLTFQEQILLDFLMRLEKGPVNLTVEYLQKNAEFPNVTDGSSDYSAYGISVIPIVSLKDIISKDIEIVGRYDRWDQTDDNADKHLLNAFTAGLNYNFMHDEKSKPAMQAQLNFTQKSYDPDESGAAYQDDLKDSFTVMAQLKWRFSHKI
nr:hypothetical protein [Candidatus Cloacimonadota bacterium]